MLTEAPLDDGSSEPPGLAPKTIISTFGGLHIREGGQDWAQALRSRSVTGFVWLRLLVAGVMKPGSQVARHDVAGQASPRQSRDVQLKRLRNVISKGLPELPPVLRDRILVMPESMSFNLEDCEIDAIELINLSAATAGRRELSPTEAARVQRVLSACQGTFLPEFEAIEDFATDRHPTCTELIRELRESLVEKRVELSLLLADAHLRAGRPADAVRVLEPPLTDRPQREDLVDRLAAAYRGAGREAEAKALEARYA
jgi:DNA-binding SARP family transcriptional activator